MKYVGVDLHKHLIVLCVVVKVDGCPKVVKRARFHCHEGVAINLEASRVLLTPGPAECVGSRPDRHVHKPALFQHRLPVCARQATSNSGCPKIDVADRRFGNRLAVRNVGEL